MKEIHILHFYHPYDGIQQIAKSISEGKKVSRKEYRDYLLIARSQFELAKHIMNNPNVPLIIENHEAIVYSPNHPLAVKCKELFPKGLPKDFNHLTAFQRQFLLDFGGSAFPVLSNAISVSYQDDLRFYHNKAKTDKLLKHLNSFTDESLQIKENMNIEREYATLHRALQVAELTGSENVAIACGKTHSFKGVDKCVPGDYKIKTFDLTAKNFDLESAGPSERGVDHAMKTRRNLFINCTSLNQELPRVNYALPSSQNSNSEIVGANAAMFGASVVAVGVLAFGLFKCCINPCLKKTESKKDKSRKPGMKVRRMKKNN